MKHFFRTKNIINTILTGALLVSGLAFGSGAYAFTDMEGKKDDITNHIGKNKWTIVEVWESNCHMCRLHMPKMVKFNGKLNNARILGISLDGQKGKAAAEEFIEDYDVNFPTLLSNPIEMNAWMQESIGESLIGTPTFILFDAKGKLVAAQPGVVSTESLEKFITENSKPAPKPVSAKPANTENTVAFSATYD